VRLLSWFLAGALLTTVTIGTLVVFLLQQTDLVSHSRTTFGAAADLVGSAAALLAAFFLRRRGRSEDRTPPTGPRSPGWSERALTRGGLLAFVVGIVLNVFPGVFPFVALTHIAELDYSHGATVALVVGFYLIMFVPAEVPLASYLFAPQRTTVVVGRFNSWLKRNARSVAVYVLVAIAIYLAARGIAAL